MTQLEDAVLKLSTDIDHKECATFRERVRQMLDCNPILAEAPLMVKASLASCHFPSNAAPMAPAKRASGPDLTSAFRVSLRARNIMGTSQKPPVR